MSLTEKYASPLSLFFSFKPKKKVGTDAGTAVSKTFEENLIARLSSLLPIPDFSPSLTLLWLSRAVDLLTLTLADAANIISDPSLPITDLAVLSSHLDFSVALLDGCNAIFAAVDRILRGRILVRLALHLISSSPSISFDCRRRARSAITEWEAVAASPSHGYDLRRLRPKDPNRGRLTAVRRVIYAVEAVSDLVARSVLTVLGDKGDFLLGIHVSGKFPWAAAYNEVVAKVSAKLCWGEIAGEVQAAKASVRRLAVAVDDEDGSEGITAELRNSVGEAEKTMKELTEGLDRLSNAVNGLFSAALETRDAALQCFRVGPGKCK